MYGHKEGCLKSQESKREIPDVPMFWNGDTLLLNILAFLHAMIAIFPLWSVKVEEEEELVFFFFKYLSQWGIFERERACHVKGRWPYILVKISKGLCLCLSFSIVMAFVSVIGLCCRAKKIILFRDTSLSLIWKRYILL
jgi:hypothetical protein